MKETENGDGPERSREDHCEISIPSIAGGTSGEGDDFHRTWSVAENEVRREVFG